MSTSKNDTDVVVAGHICLDIIPDLSQLPREDFASIFRPGSLIIMGATKFTLGGSVSNTGLALHVLGINTLLMGKVGNDLFGQAMLQIMESYQKGLSSVMIIDEKVQSSYTFVINPPNVDRFFMHCPGANDTFDDVNLDLLEGSRLFHFGYPPAMRMMYEDNGERLAEIYRQVKRKGITTSMDMSLPAPESASGKADWVTILKKTLPYVDIFLPSAEELLFMIKRKEYDYLMAQTKDGDILPLVTPDLLISMANILHEFGTKIVAIKMGYRGLFVHCANKTMLERIGNGIFKDVNAWANKVLWAPIFKVDVVGTTGSGDSTIAGFLSAILRGYSAEDAIIAGTAVGACNVEAADSLSGLRSWEATMKRIEEGWIRVPLSIQSKSWEYDNNKELWVMP